MYHTPFLKKEIQQSGSTNINLLEKCDVLYNNSSIHFSSKSFHQIHINFFPWPYLINNGSWLSLKLLILNLQHHQEDVPLIN